MSSNIFLNQTIFPFSPTSTNAPSISSSSNKRMKGITVSRALVYGNIAFPLGKKAEEGRTHRWICYVRGVQNEDLSYMIKKVIFSLHPSFPNPKRVVEKFPFEVQEEGWGEFEIAIKVHRIFHNFYS